MKYIIEIADNCLVEYNKDMDTYFGTLYRAKGFNTLVFDKEGLDRLTPLDKALSSELEKAYQKGFEAGKAQDEDRCIGCKYDDGTTEHSPCDYCCNAYSNQWQAKPKSNEFKIGEEVITSNKKRAIVIDVDVIEETNATIVKVLKGTCTWWYKISELTKTGRYFPQIEELFRAMKEGTE